MAIFFTADTHLGHANIIKHAGRPFVSPAGTLDVAAMDAAIVTRWNRVVGPRDTVYHLGDICWKLSLLEGYLGQLNGRIILLRGNHDDDRLKPVKNLVEVHRLLDLKICGQKITLCHYALRTWNCSHHGAWHIYGHSHGSLADDPRSLSFDIGVDCWNFTPVSWDQVTAEMATKTPHT